MKDVFQTIKPMAVGKERYTFYERKNYREKGRGWRLDQFAVREELLQQRAGELCVDDIQVREECKGSDHVPLVLTLRRCPAGATRNIPTSQEIPETNPTEINDLKSGDREIWETCCALAEAVEKGTNPYLDEEGKDPDMLIEPDDPTHQMEMVTWYSTTFPHRR